MTDTITPEPTADDYRAAEKVLRAARFGGFRGGYDDEADWCKEEAARLEAESARDEEANGWRRCSSTLRLRSLAMGRTRS
ncbi:hypothetical protein GS483_00005 [Rhodococcus hoagii]|nr:hypothetical protein [Prescottella equi]